jgi:hypothetical protein
VEACDTRYRAGCVTHVHKGDVPSRSQSVAPYVAKYVVRPPLALRRLDRYDGHRVTYHYRSHTSERVERETVDVSVFIGRMMQPVWPKGCQRIRSDGVQATTTLAQIHGMMREAWAKVTGMVKGAIKIIAPLTSRQRDQQRPGRDPLRCPHGQRAMGRWRLWHPIYGLIHDERKAIARGKEASQAPRADPAGRPGHTLWPAAGGRPLSLPGLP